MKLIPSAITAFGTFAFYVTARISGHFQLLLWCSAINQLVLQCGRRRCRRLQLFSHCARSKRAEMQEDGKHTWDWENYECLCVFISGYLVSEAKLFVRSNIRHENVNKC